MYRMIRRLAAPFVMLLVLASGLSACTESAPSTAQQQADARNKGVDQIRQNQPVAPMEYSSTLDTINRWAETWGQKGQVSYVYMRKADGAYAGYYVMSGLPVSYCVGGSPPYDTIQQDLGGHKSDVNVPAPGLDGAYYGGCNMNRYYGFDAVTGQYIEYTDGYVLTAVLSNQPLPDTAGVRPYISAATAAEQAEEQGAVFDPETQESP